MRYLGIACAIGAYVIWGILPLYWRLLASIPVAEIVLHRIFWCAVFVSAPLLLRSPSKLFAPFAERRKRFMVLGAAIVIAINWCVFVYAVSSENLIQASLGYYLSPLFSILLGVLFLRERLSVLQWVAASFATIGVIILVLALKETPIISLTLMATFGFYGLIKKISGIGSLHSLSLETLSLCPIVITLLLVFYPADRGSFSIGSNWAMLIGAGFVTALPLYLFGLAARRVKLSQVGFFQYIGPTIMLSLGVFSFGENFYLSYKIGFGLVWVALGFYTASLFIGRSRNARVIKMGVN